MHQFITGIQQAGIGVKDASAAKHLYRNLFGMDVLLLVETHKVPLCKKFGLYINLKKRKSNKPLPGWKVGLLGLNKIK